MKLNILKSLLEEVQARMEHPLHYMRPFDLELTNPLPTESRTKTYGTQCKSTFDIEPELYAILQHRLPEGVTLKGIMWVEEEMPLPEKKKREAKPKQPEEPLRTPEQELLGKMWSRLIYKNTGFVSCPGVREAMAGCDMTKPELTHAALKEAFHVEHMSEVSIETAATIFGEQARVMMNQAMVAVSK